MSTLKLRIEYEWSGLEELCLPQADRVMAALLATDDRGPQNAPKVTMDVVVASSRARTRPDF